MERRENKHSYKRRDHSQRKFFKEKKKIPVNLLKKAQRERRQQCLDSLTSKKRQRKNRKSKKDFRDIEHEALVKATEDELKNILSNNETLSDIPFDCTPEELLGEIALAEGNGTIVYIERDGLSTLTIVLPQEKPTIANLKRAIEVAARVQLKRELRERHEERIRRRGREQPATISSNSERIDDSPNGEKQQQNSSETLLESSSHIRNTGELVCSATHNGHQHRSNVSWRFLWRAYMLFHMETRKPIEDSNGRRLLSEFGIENATTLKFCKREKYFGRKRQ